MFSQSALICMKGQHWKAPVWEILKLTIFIARCHQAYKYACESPGLGTHVDISRPQVFLTKDLAFY